MRVHLARKRKQQPPLLQSTAQDGAGQPSPTKTSLSCWNLHARPTAQVSTRPFAAFSFPPAPSLPLDENKKRPGREKPAIPVTDSVASIIFSPFYGILSRLNLNLHSLLLFLLLLLSFFLLPSSFFSSQFPFQTPNSQRVCLTASLLSNEPAVAPPPFHTCESSILPPLCYLVRRSLFVVLRIWRPHSPSPGSSFLTPVSQQNPSPPGFS